MKVFITILSITCLFVLCSSSWTSSNWRQITIQDFKDQQWQIVQIIGRMNLTIQISPFNSRLINSQLTYQSPQPGYMIIKQNNPLTIVREIIYLFPSVLTIIVSDSASLNFIGKTYANPIRFLADRSRLKISYNQNPNLFISISGGIGFVDNCKVANLVVSLVSSPFFINDTTATNLRINGSSSMIAIGNSTIENVTRDLDSNSSITADRTTKIPRKSPAPRRQQQSRMP